VSESKTKIFSATLTTLYWAKMHGHRLRGFWNSGEPCTACQLSKRPEERVMSVVR